jgi:hypothetical protein
VILLWYTSWSRTNRPSHPDILYPLRSTIYTCQTLDTCSYSPQVQFIASRRLQSYQCGLRSLFTCTFETPCAPKSSKLLSDVAVSIPSQKDHTNQSPLIHSQTNLHDNQHRHHDGHRCSNRRNPHLHDPKNQISRLVRPGKAPHQGALHPRLDPRK